MGYSFTFNFNDNKLLLGAIKPPGSLASRSHCVILAYLKTHLHKQWSCWAVSASWSETWAPLEEGRRWWSSSPPRWCWESAGSGAAGLTETLRWPATPPWGRGRRSSRPLQRSPANRKYSDVQHRVSSLSSARQYTFLVSQTFALASRAASASAAMALCIWNGSLTSLISTRSTLMPQWSVASSRLL